MMWFDVIYIFLIRCGFKCKLESLTLKVKGKGNANI